MKPKGHLTLQLQKNQPMGQVGQKFFETLYQQELQSSFFTLVLLHASQR
jgi:hypothetical protein